MFLKKAIATRHSFGRSIVEYGKENKNIVVLEADLGKSTQSFHFQKEFPERYFQIGIAEANMIGIASGLALSGKIPFICSFSVFLTGCYDKIRMSIAYPKANVKIIGTHGGLGTGSDGNSQQALEDISIMRSLPNMTIFQPSDDIEAVKLIKKAIEIKGPVFIRLTRQELPIIHETNYIPDLNSIDIIKEGSDIAIFATGSTVIEALKAAEIIEKNYNNSVQVINIHTLKPINEENILQCIKNKKMLLSVEDHSIIGGLGSIIAEVLVEKNNHPPLFRIAIKGFGTSGSQEDLYRQFKINAEAIVERFVKEKCFM